jgi:glutamine synthetase
MKQVVVYLRPEQLPAVKQALYDAEIRHLTAISVLGTAPKSEQQMYRGVEREVELFRRMRVEVNVQDAMLETTIDAISRGAMESGGFGKIFVTELHDVAMGVRDQVSGRDVLKRIEDDEIKFIDLKFVDLFGTLQHLTVPTSIVDEDTFRHGVGFDGSSVRGFQKINESDMILMPDPNSVFRDPVFDDPALSVFCDVIDPDGYRPYSRDPRGVARRAEKLLRALGIADVAYFGPELEFFVFDEVRYDQATQHGYYFLNSAAAFWSTGGESGPSLGHQAARKQAYFAAPPVDQYNNLRSKISDVLELAGLEPELHHHEVGAAGQCEIGFRFGTLLLQADSAIKYKYVVKNVVDRYGKTVTFMPKPLLQENGSGMHVNISLSKDDQNLFYGAGGYADLSDSAIHFIGGLLKHAPALCAFCAPTTNSYRRLVRTWYTRSAIAAPASACRCWPRRPRRSGSSSARRTLRRILILHSPLFCWPGSMASATRSCRPIRSTKTSTSWPRRRAERPSHGRHHRWKNRSMRWRWTTNSWCATASSRPT